MDEKQATVDWAALREEASKLGISLAELQQRKRQRQLLKEAKDARLNSHPKPEQ